MCAGARLGPAALGLSPGSVLAVKMLLAENFYLLLNSQSSLTEEKKGKEKKKKRFSVHLSVLAPGNKCTPMSCMSSALQVL